MKRSLLVLVATLALVLGVSASASAATAIRTPAVPERWVGASLVNPETVPRYGHHDYRRHRALYGRQRKCQRPVHPDADLHERHDCDLRHHVLAEGHDQLLAKPESETSKGTLVQEGPLHLVGGRCR
jgi:hypothetical protein